MPERDRPSPGPDTRANPLSIHTRPPPGRPWRHRRPRSTTGHPPIVSPTRDVVDFGGVTDPEVARRPGGYFDKHVGAGWLEAERPDAIVLHAAVRPSIDDDGRLVTLAGYAVERRVARLPWVRAHYRVARIVEYADDYYYVALLRDADR